MTRTILLVEDDPIVGMMLRDMLEQLGCEVIGPSGSVKAALAMLERHAAPHGAVLDCNLGREKVWPVADELVARQVPFVFSTGYGEAGVLARYYGVPVLAKPYQLRDLELALLPLLGQA